MRGIVCYYEGQYFIWSKVVDAPITYGMTEYELVLHTQVYQGESGVTVLRERMERARERGHSSVIYDDLHQLTRTNRAGYKGTRLSFEEIVRIYLDECRDPVEGEGTPIVHDEAD